MAWSREETTEGADPSPRCQSVRISARVGQCRRTRHISDPDYAFLSIVNAVCDMKGTFLYKETIKVFHCDGSAESSQTILLLFILSSVIKNRQWVALF